MQALEDDEDPLGVLGLDPDPVVRAGELPEARVVIGAPRLEADDRQVVGAELQRVGDEVVEDGDEQRAVAAHDGQPADVDRRGALLDDAGERRERVGDEL